MKKITFVVIFMIIFSFTACEKKAPEPVVKEVPLQEEANGQAQEEAPPVEHTGKIGIITGSASQGEYEFLAAQNMKSKYGDRIQTATFPDNYEKEPEKLIAETLQLAKSGVEAIVFVKAVMGTADAIDKVRESYPDMLFICGQSDEEPTLISSKADIVMIANDIEMGSAMSLQAKKMGAKTFVHYTFPRHMADEMLSERRDLLRASCEENGIQFVDATIPDPEGEGGIAEAKQFIIDDIPRMAEKYGKDTAVYSTSCEVQEDIIKMAMQEGVLYPQQCHPEPYHAYPGALRIQIPDGKKGDIPYVLEKIEKEITVKGGNGRFSTWPKPIDMLFVEAGVEYSIGYLEGAITDRKDIEALSKIYSDLMGEAGDAVLTEYVLQSGQKLKNYYLVLSGYVNF